MAFLPFLYSQKINMLSGDRRLLKHLIFFLLLMISSSNKKKKRQIIIFKIRTPFEALFPSLYMDIQIVFILYGHKKLPLCRTSGMAARTQQCSCDVDLMASHCDTKAVHQMGWLI